MPYYSLDGVAPVVHPSAYVHPTAVLIGDVFVGENCYIGPHASLRGDFGGIVIEAGANVQDSCVIHGFPDRTTLIEQSGHIGHGAVLHGCVVRRNAMVGIKAVVLDEAEVGERAIVGACALVPAGSKVAERSLVVGTPARFVRALTDDEMAWKEEGTREYQALAQRCDSGLKEVQPHAAPAGDRAKSRISRVMPLHAFRRG